MTKRSLPKVQNPRTNIQRMMNLVMPLADPTPNGKARLVAELALHRPSIDTALNNVGTLHFARFNVVGPYLLMMSVYDGSAQSYTRDIALQLGDLFDVVMSHVADWPPPNAERPWEDPDQEDPRPVYRVADNPDLFIEWVMAHDIEQIPRNPIELLDGDDESMTMHHASATPKTDQLMFARLVEMFRKSEHVHISAYRGIPHAAASKIRDALGQGW